MEQQFKNLVKRTRSYRRFDESYKISNEFLRDLIENVRFVASAKNAQPLRYITVTDEQLVNKLTEFSSWAGFLKDWNGPIAGERPTAYILIGAVEALSAWTQVDVGIAMQTILLHAAINDIHGCIIGAFRKNEVQKLLKVDLEITPLYMIALGSAGERISLEEMTTSQYAYWRSEDQIHHVPKRPLSEILLKQL